MSIRRSALACSAESPIKNMSGKKSSVASQLSKQTTLQYNFIIAQNNKIVKYYKFESIFAGLGIYSRRSHQYPRNPPLPIRLVHVS